MKKALEGLVMIDLTHMLSGPFGAMLLADMGMEVIKVEPLGGEGTRNLLATDSLYSRNGMGAYFLTLNRNKKSICIDLKKDSGLEVFYKLVGKADVVFDNFGAGVTQKLKIDYPRLSEINPRIVTCSVTGFGQTGPYVNYPAFDQVVQGMGGGMSITGFPDGLPVRAGIPIGDLGGGLYGAIGILAALQARQITGRGQHVDISMLDCQISLLNYMATMYLLSGMDPSRLGNGHFVHVPYDAFETKTDPIIIAVIGDSFWREFKKVIKVPEFENQKYDIQPGRYEDKQFILKKIQEVLHTQAAELWLSSLSQSRIPCAPINKFSQALSHPQVLARNMVVEVDLPQWNGEVVKIKLPGNPIKLSKTHEDSFAPPPVLGQHTDHVLNILGFNTEHIKALREDKVVA